MTDLEMLRDWCEVNWQEGYEACLRIQAEIERLRGVAARAEHAETNLDKLDEAYGKALAELERLREENASLVDRHNRESHGTMSHEALAYDHQQRELEHLRARIVDIEEHWAES